VIHHLECPDETIQELHRALPTAGRLVTIEVRKHHPLVVFSNIRHWREEPWC